MTSIQGSVSLKSVARIFLCGLVLECLKSQEQKINAGSMSFDCTTVSKRLQKTVFGFSGLLQWGTVDTG